MKRSRFTDSQILAVLKQAEAGAAVPDLCRKRWVITRVIRSLEQIMQWR
jgi:hypothetical protein